MAGLTAFAWQQTWQWRDSETLWTHALACTSANPTVHNNLGQALADRGQFDAAIVHYQKALEIKPDFAEAYTNLGTVMFGGGQVDEAIARFRRSLAIDPNYVPAHNNLGLALVGRGS